MLFLLQFALFLCFLIILVQVIVDAFRGSILVLSGLLLLLVAYAIKLVFGLLRLIQRYCGRRRPPVPGRFRIERP